jgi:pimeloyl-ACP methyl ester carboxylesterase
VSFLGLAGIAASVVVLVLLALALFTQWQTRRIERRHPPIGRLVEAEGGVIHVVDKPGEGHERGSVLLLHGASGNQADMTLALQARLSGLGFRVLAVDRPGHGWSSRILGRLAAAPARQARLVSAALAQLGVTRSIVVGHSFAGTVALALALEAPEFTRALVLLAPVSHPWPGGVDWRYRLSATPILGWAFRQFIVMPFGLLLLPSGLRSVFEPNETPKDYQRATGLALMLRPWQYRANAEDVVDLKPYVTEQAQRYSEIKAPTEIVTGDKDGVVYTHIHSVGCARDIGEANLTTLTGVGHAPHHSATEAVVAAILSAERRALEREGVAAAPDAEAVLSPG